jgi:membrane-associated phospholipid phosphatase
MRSRWMALVLIVLWPGVVWAQTAADSTVPPASTAPTPTYNVTWWQTGVALGGLAVLSLADKPVNTAIQNMRTTTTDDIADVLQYFGSPVVFVPATVVPILVGLISHNENLTMSGIRIGSSLLLAGATAGVLKYTVGRWRPNETSTQYEFGPFSGHDSWPSGHTTMAFALASSASYEIHRTWATVGLYTLAAGTGWARMNNEKHWLTDVGGGVLIGITSAKFIDRQWEVFGITAPSFLFSSEEASVSFNISMPPIR